MCSGVDILKDINNISFKIFHLEKTLHSTVPKNCILSIVGIVFIVTRSSNVYMFFL